MYPRIKIPRNVVIEGIYRSMARNRIALIIYFTKKPLHNAGGRFFKCHCISLRPLVYASNALWETITKHYLHTYQWLSLLPNWGYNLAASKTYAKSCWKFKVSSPSNNSYKTGKEKYKLTNWPKRVPINLTLLKTYKSLRAKKRRVSRRFYTLNVWLHIS